MERIGLDIESDCPGLQYTVPDLHVASLGKRLLTTACSCSTVLTEAQIICHFGIEASLGLSCPWKPARSAPSMSCSLSEDNVQPVTDRGLEKGPEERQAQRKEETARTKRRGKICAPLGVVVVQQQC